MSSLPTGMLFYDGRAKPLNTIGGIQPGSYYLFYLTGTLTQTNVYADGGLTTPLSQTPLTGGTTAASDGRLVAIYLNPSVTYRYQLYSAAGVLLEDIDPYVVPLSAKTILSGVANIVSFGADPTGVVDSAPAIQAAVTSVQTSGGIVSYPPGTYLINSTIPDVQNVLHVGSGINATTVKTNGNFPVFTRAGSATVTINCGGIRDMAIHGSWAANNANSLSYGISCTGSNGAIYENLRILGCAVGFYGAFNFESFVNNVKILGAGADLNQMGVVLDYTNSTNPNNAFYMVNVGVFGTSGDGWEIRNGNGSNFVNCSAELCGGNGFAIGFSGTGTINPQFMQFSNCTGDSCTGPNWLIQGTVSLTAQDLLFNNCWSGLTAANNWVFINTIDTIFTGNNGISPAQSCIFLNGGCSIDIIGFTGRNFNTSSGGYAGINISNSSNNLISGCDVHTLVTGGGALSIAENGTSNNNVIDGNLAPQNIQILGNATRCINNRGFNPVGIQNAATAGTSPYTVTAGPSPETHYISQSATNTATVAKGGKTLGTLSAGTTLVVELDANATYVITWTTTAPTYVRDIH